MVIVCNNYAYPNKQVDVDNLMGFYSMEKELIITIFNLRHLQYTMFLQNHFY